MSRIGKTLGVTGQYTDRIPGLTAYTPIYQLGVPQTPRLGDMQTAINDILQPPAPANSGTDLLASAENLISQNPLPVLAVLAYLILTR